MNYATQVSINQGLVTYARLVQGQNELHYTGQHKPRTYYICLTDWSRARMNYTTQVSINQGLVTYARLVQGQNELRYTGQHKPRTCYICQTGPGPE
ncbi:hypothetical protein ACJMK2_009131 [Sinanodonta woodiana]|uniref:Uncharacterized protein n=1 Tax=Sinanodonta woodiana TaxID=1069815 RepID=A0ABD3VBD2_SINWO